MDGSIRMDDAKQIECYLQGIERRFGELKITDNYILGQMENIRYVIDNQAKWKQLYWLETDKGKNKEVGNYVRIDYGAFGIIVRVFRDLSGRMYKLYVGIDSRESFGNYFKNKIGKISHG